MGASPPTADAHLRRVPPATSSTLSAFPQLFESWPYFGRNRRKEISSLQGSRLTGFWQLVLPQIARKKATGCTIPSAAGLRMEIPADNSRRHHLNRAEKDSAVPQGSSPDFDPNRTLEEITRSAQYVTGASGAALALSDGKVIACRACSGYPAPPVGTQLNTDIGLTATCVQTAEVVCCDDTEADPRVDSSKCIGIRSILAVPVFDDPGVAGVLEVLSSKPKRFTDRHVTALQLLARLVETHVNYVSRGNGPLDTSASDAKLTWNDSGAANTDVARVVCVSCGHPNPQGSQFCNRCGVILYISPDLLDRTVDLSLPEGTESIDNEGLKEIYKLISGNAGPATWSELSAKLLANLQSASAQDKLHTAATEETAKREKIR
jgi:GAF domain